MYEKPEIKKLTATEAAFFLYGDYDAPPVRRSKGAPVKMPVHNRGAKTLRTGIRWVRT